MTDSKQLDEGKRTRPFADFLNEHNGGEGHREASEKIQEVVQAVIDTGKAGSVTLKVDVAPMKGAEDGTLMIAVNVAAKVPVTPSKAAVFYADDDNNLTRTDPKQLTFEGLREVEGPGEVREVAAPAAVREVGGGAR